MDNTDIMISVILITYNHEEYIRQALESIINQKTQYRYEVIVGDDCSKDNTQSIISEYQNRYPDKIFPVLRTKNVGGKRNMYDIMFRCKGKYIAFLEGDDYWTDDLKLEKQISFLENNPEYIACAHRFHVVNRYGESYYDRDLLVQFVSDSSYTLKDFENGKMVSHLNSIVYQNIYRQKGKEFFKFWLEFDNMTGDAVINLILVLMGNVYCMQEDMSAYRKVTDERSSSFSAMQEKENKRDILFKSQMDLEKLIYEVFGQKVSFKIRKKNIFASAVFKLRRDKTQRNRQVVREIIKQSGQPVYYRLFYIYLIIAKNILQLIYKEDKRVPF